MPEDPTASDAIGPANARVLALLMEGLSTPEIAATLGLGLADVEGNVFEIRQILGVPDAHDLVLFVRERFSSLVPSPAPQEPSTKVEDERRVRLLLRLTFEDLLRIADDARLRATMLHDTTVAVGTADEASARQEAEELITVSNAIRELVGKLLNDIRGKA